MLVADCCVSVVVDVVVLALLSGVAVAALLLPAIALLWVVDGVVSEGMLLLLGFDADVALLCVAVLGVVVAAVLGAFSVGFAFCCAGWPFTELVVEVCAEAGFCGFEDWMAGLLSAVWVEAVLFADCEEVACDEAGFSGFAPGAEVADWPAGLLAEAV